MITAHLPAGYLLARGLGAPRAALPFALLGSVFPDFDLFWFYFVDERAFHHHKYWVHAPLFWLPVMVLALVILHVFTWKRIRFPVKASVTIFFVALFLHILLDSLAGSIMWLWPWSDRLYVLAEVPATRSHWVLSFLTHWTFLVELAIWGLAAFSFWRHRAQMTG